LDDNCLDPILMEITSGVYEDEETGEIVNLGAEGETLMVLIPSFATTHDIENICLTPLTTMAAESAISQLQADPDADVNAVIYNAQINIAQQFELSDIVFTPPVLPDDVEGRVYNSQLNYAHVLHAMCALANEYDPDSTAVDYMAVLIEDILDGAFDGMGAGGQITFGARTFNGAESTTEMARIREEIGPYECPFEYEGYDTPKAWEYHYRCQNRNYYEQRN